MSSVVPCHHRSSFDTMALFTQNWNQMKMTMEKLFRQNRFDQKNLRRIRRRKVNFWKNKPDFLPFPLYTSVPFTATSMYGPPVIYQVEQELRYVPYPIRAATRGDPFGLTQNLGLPGFPGMTTSANLFGSLPPKIRVIFIPTQPEIPSLPPVMPQPVQTGPLTMPPFLFNRMSSLSNCFALPPPLPDLNSLQLTPAVQQMVMQRYNNPSVVLPFVASFSGFNQIPMPTSAFQSFPPAAPLSFLNPPAQQEQQQQPCPCRACPPAPPALEIPVKDYSWVQHCSACGGVRNVSSEPNPRPSAGRVTPLLGKSPRNSPLNLTSPMNFERYQRVKPWEKERIWSHKLPPLPQGAILISDEVFDSRENNLAPRVFRSRKRTKNVQINGHSSSCSTSTDEKIISKSSSRKTNFARQQILSSAKNLNLRYKFSAQDVASVYQKNSYEKSTSDDSLSSSISNEMSKKNRSLVVNEYKSQRAPPAPRILNSIVEENLRSFSPCSIGSTNSKKKKPLVVRQYSMKSPSINSNSELFIVVKESTVSLLKSEKDKIVLHETLSLKTI